MNIVAWIKSKNWKTHTVIVGAASLAITIASDSAIQDWIKTTLAAHPQLASLIVLASIAVAKQSHSSSDAGTLANANDIKFGPNAANAPTASEVDAASVK